MIGQGTDHPDLGWRRGWTLDRDVEDDIDDNYRERYLDKDTHSNMRGRWTLDKY